MSSHLRPIRLPLLIVFGSSPAAAKYYWDRELFAAIPFICVALIAAFYAWLDYALNKRSKPIDPIRCPACGYDLRATPNRCPECGQIPPDHQSLSPSE